MLGRADMAGRCAGFTLTIMTPELVIADIADAAAAAFANAHEPGAGVAVSRAFAAAPRWRADSFRAHLALPAASIAVVDGIFASPDAAAEFSAGNALIDTVPTAAGFAASANVQAFFADCFVASAARGGTHFVDMFLRAVAETNERFILAEKAHATCEAVEDDAVTLQHSAEDRSFLEERQTGPLEAFPHAERNLQRHRRLVALQSSRPRIRPRLHERSQLFIGDAAAEQRQRATARRRRICDKSCQRGACDEPSVQAKPLQEALGAFNEANDCHFVRAAVLHLDVRN